MSRGVEAVAPPSAPPAADERSAAGRLRDAGEFLLPFAAAAVAWELFAALGPLPPRLFPSLGTVARTFGGLLASGVLLANAQARSSAWSSASPWPPSSGWRSGSRWVATAGPRTSCCRW